MADILTELKRRKVVRVAIVYGATVFVILQAADLVVAPLRLPPWTMTLLVVLAIAGLPVAVVLAWAYELADGGVRATPAASGAGPVPSLIGKRTLLVAAGLVLVGIGLGAGWVLGPATRAPGAPARPAADPSIAVLPFADMTADGSLAYFGDGMAEEILTALGRVPGLRVAGRTSSFSFRGRAADLREIGEALDVAAILEGSVRRSGDRLRVHAQLVRADDQSRIWSETFERFATEDVFDVQDEIANSIVDALALRLTGEQAAALRDWGTRDPAAYDAYLQGRFQWLQRTREGVLGSIEAYRAAIRADPGFARAHAGLADAFAIAANFQWLRPDDAFPAAREAAHRAIALAPALPDAHVSMAAILHWYYADYEAAERAFRTAIALDPRHAFARYWYGILLDVTGRHDEALEQVLRARDLEPLALQIRAGVGDHYAVAGDLLRALEVYDAVFRINPDFHNSRRWRANVLIELGRPDDALADLDRIPATWRDTRAQRARALALAGRAAEAERLLAELADDPDTVSVTEIGLAYAELGRMDEAFRWLRRGIAERDFHAQFLPRTPAGHPLRADPRFAGLVRDLGLDRYWPAASR